MAELKIRIYNDPVLRRKAAPIDEITPEIKQLARDMAETMYAAHGIGLAATQVGVEKRIIVVDVEWARAEDDERPEPRPRAMINPEVLEESVEDWEYDEGCLSLPDLEGEVWRGKTVKIRYQTLSGKVLEEECEGLHGRCILHEIDHLDGVLFIDRMAPAERKKLDRALLRLDKSMGTGKDASEAAAS